MRFADGQAPQVGECNRVTFGMINLSSSRGRILTPVWRRLQASAILTLIMDLYILRRHSPRNFAHRRSIEDPMPFHPRAGQLAQPDQLVDLKQLEQAYYDETPEPADPQQRVSFGTSGHRGS